MRRSPTADAILTALRDLAYVEGERRTLDAWHLLTTTDDDSAVEVGADYAVGHDLLASDAGERLLLQHHARLNQTAWRNPTDQLELVWIPGGNARLMRWNSLVTRPGFSLARHPVTNAQWARFVDESGYSPPASHPEPDTYLAHWKDGACPTALLNHPVVQVSYIDALHYTLWAGLTLPTEFMWEKAARGADGNTWPWGATPPTTELVRMQAATTAPVGSYPRTRTAYGCEDMVGNVSEWCQPDSIYASPPIRRPAVDPDPTAHPSSPVRGTAFLRNINKDSIPARTRYLSVFRRNQWVGFRPALMPLAPG